MRIRRPLCIINVMFILIVYIILSIMGGIDEREYISDGSSIIFEGVIKDKSTKNGNQILHVTLKADSLKLDNKTSVCDIDKLKSNHKYDMILYLKDSYVDDFHIGQRIAISGIFNNFSLPENEGQFNMRRYYRIRNYLGLLKNTKIYWKSKKWNGYRDVLFNIKKRTERVFYTYMSDTDAATLSAMVLGDKAELDSEIKELYQEAGISHILSLSGLHIATVGVSLYSLFMLVGTGVSFASATSLFVMLSYGIMTGMSTSTLRALIMFILVLLSRNIGRTYDLLSGVCLASILIILENPYYIYDSGFMLSFLSVIGIGLLYPVVIELIHFKSIGVSLSANLATLPVTANSFYKISRYGVFVNLLVVPLMSVLLFMGIIAGVIGNVFLSISPYNMSVKVILFITEKILKLYSYVAQFGADLPFNTWVIGKIKLWQIIVYSVLLILAYVFNERDFKLKKLVCSLLLAMAVLTVSLKCRPSYELDVLSVGQGACSVISGSDVPTVMFDGGSSDVGDVGKYRIKPYLLSKGIDTIDCIFISHADLDHVSGIKELLDTKNRDIKIKKIVMSLRDESIEKLAKAKGVEVYIMKVGDEVVYKNLLITCLSPKLSNKSSDEDLNDLSLVLKASYSKKLNDKNANITNAYNASGDTENFSVLFPGDISSNVEKNILKKELQSDILIVPHHGSKYSSSDEFLRSVGAKVCIISAGKNNSYGHPHVETLERINRINAKILRTDELGQIKIKR